MADDLRLRPRAFGGLGPFALGRVLMRDPVANIAALSAIPATERQDGLTAVVLGEKDLFTFYASSADASDGSLVIQPDDAPAVGRWHREQGLQGPQGPQGDQGPQGLQGPQGDPGPAGADGSTARRSITLRWVTPSSPGTSDVHANFRGDDASNNFPGPFTNPDMPRTARVNFGAAWDGGNVTVSGTNMADQAISEVFVPPGSGFEESVDGTKCFKTFTGATKAAQGSSVDAGNFASIGRGGKLGINDSSVPSTATLNPYCWTFRDGSSGGKAVDTANRTVNFDFELNGINDVYAIVDVTPA